VTVSWFSRRRRRDFGNRPAVVALTTLALLSVAAASHPALAASEEPRVIAVHTTEESDVSIVLTAPAVADGELAPDELSALLDGVPVRPKVTPMASSHLSVALVIDTAADTTAEALQVAKSGAAEFLLGLPGGARTLVIQTGGTPRIVAPLSSKRGDALSAVSDLRTSGARSTTEGTLLAAQELASAPAGPRAIIVYTAGSDERGASVEQLTQAVSRAAAVINVIQTGGNQSWSSVVNRAGALLRVETGEVVQSYRRLLDALGDQYVVAFKAPGELPGKAQLTVDTGDVESSIDVPLPEAETAADAAPQRSVRGNAGSDIWSVAGVLSGLALIALALLAVLLRFRERTFVPAEEPPDGAIEARTGTTSEPPAAAKSPKEEIWPTPIDGPSPETPTTAPATRSLDRRSKRGLLTDAVQGRRSAQHNINSAPKHESQHGPVQDVQRLQHAPADKPARPPPADGGPRGRRANVALHLATLLSRAGSRIAARAKPADGKRSNEEVSNATFVLTGSGDAVAKLNTHLAGPWAVKITGNAASRYFSVQALDTEDDLVITLDRYWGIRSLNWNGGKCTGFKIRANGPWRIEVLPLTSVPSFRTAFEGQGDMVVRFTGHGSRAEITCNDVGRYFNVRARSSESTQRLVTTTDAYSGTHPISGETQYFEVQAVGPWTVTVR
jgi:von Willebrand factor type A domain